MAWSTFSSMWRTRACSVSHCEREIGLYTAHMRASQTACAASKRKGFSPRPSPQSGKRNHRILVQRLAARVAKRCQTGVKPIGNISWCAMIMNSPPCTVAR
jgi:hypothetical protein